MTEIAYIYDGTLEGLLTCVFKAYERHEDPSDIVSESSFQPRLDQSAVEIATDFELAQRVRNGIEKKCGGNVFKAVAVVAMSDEPDMGVSALGFIRYALARGASALSDLTHPKASRFIELHRSVLNERHYMQQFIRFRQVEGGVYFAQCNPKANVVPLLMGWFSARFNDQPFMIYDENHSIAGIHNGIGWQLVRTDVLVVPDDTKEEKAFAHAWRTFYDTVAVEARYNPELRRGFMPVRFWKNITEVSEKVW